VSVAFNHRKKSLRRVVQASAVASAVFVGGAAAAEPACGPDPNCKQATEVANNTPRTPTTEHPVTSYTDFFLASGGTIGASATFGAF
jgi:hypothetical protein